MLPGMSPEIKGETVAVEVLVAVVLTLNVFKPKPSNNNSVTTTTTGNLASITLINNLQTRTKVSRGWAEPFLDLKLGGLITPETLAYVIGGISYNRATINSSSNFQSSGTVNTIFGVPPAVTTASTTTNFGYSENRNMFGLRVGAGMEVLVTENFGVGADYIYSFYPSYHSSSSDTGSAVTCEEGAGGCQIIPTTVTNNTNTALSDQQVMAKFIYHLA